MTTVERIMGRVEMIPESGCWIWMGSTYSNGYGSIKVNGKICLVHRVIYEEKFGTIPNGYECHHICQVKACANTSHIVLVTKAEHVAIDGRLERIAEKRRNRVCCPKGHPYNEANTYQYPDGRRCRKCHKEARKKRYQSLTREQKDRDNGRHRAKRAAKRVAKQGGQE